ncbi:hypothetical protein AEQ63_01810 [Pseudomonas sp. RIT-PI-o]|nr:hypothetical protein AEQ63_01810 [Pseudomonas sp. RIT-PI-o]
MMAVNVMASSRAGSLPHLQCISTRDLWMAGMVGFPEVFCGGLDGLIASRLAPTFAMHFDPGFVDGGHGGFPEVFAVGWMDSSRAGSLPRLQCNFDLWERACSRSF